MFSSLDMSPNSQWHVDLPGFSNAKASQTYGQCILAGGNADDCANKGYNAGINGDVMTSTTQMPSLLDRAKYVLLGALGIASANPTLAVNAGKAAAAANNDVISKVSVSRIATGLVGLILIAGAMFLFGMATFTPEGQILKAVKGAAS